MTYMEVTPMSELIDNPKLVKAGLTKETTETLKIKIDFLINEVRNLNHVSREDTYQWVLDNFTEEEKNLCICGFVSDKIQKVIDSHIMLSVMKGLPEDKCKESFFRGNVKVSE